MGKSEVVPMPKQESLLCPGWSHAEKTAIFIDDDEDEDNNVLEEDGEGLKMSNGRAVEERSRNGTNIAEDAVEVYKNQVAGHTDDGKSLGLLKLDGTLLKPITNQKCGERELRFYEEINRNNNDQTAAACEQPINNWTNKNDATKVLRELRPFLPQFYGRKSVTVRGRTVDCIVLEDLIRNFKEPCIMDIKIGRQTWDPSAGADKIARENMKYHECKRDLAFCIPGFQVYQLSTQQCIKYDRNYGKTLNKDTVMSAFRTFLNCDSGLSRSLLVQFLANLWRIQMLMREQRHFHLYASSLLLIYDARRLRESLKHATKPASAYNSCKLLKFHRTTSLYRPLSLAVLNKDHEDRIPTGFSGQLTNQGPILRTPTSPTKAKAFDVHRDVETRAQHTNVWQKSIKDLKRTHSFQNNYDKEMQHKRQNYSDMLGELCDERRTDLWATVKMIDFAHAFPAHRYDVDKNYLEGVDSLVRIFESFLVESV